MVLLQFLFVFNANYMQTDANSSTSISRSLARRSSDICCRWELLPSSLSSSLDSLGNEAGSSTSGLNTS